VRGNTREERGWREKDEMEKRRKEGERGEERLVVQSMGKLFVGIEG